MATAIQFLRSSELGLRPIPLSLTDGMPMINYNSADPGLYFRTSTDTLAKIGPCHVGNQPPNQTPLGYAEYCTGEMWLDTSLSSAPVLKVWNGSAWAFDLNTDESTLTAGAYLTGGSFDGSAAVTFAVDATDANTASKVVARDASGNFAAGTITASLTGNVTGNVTGDVTGDLTGTASVATGVTCANEATDTSCNVVFVTAATGDLPPKTSTSLTYDSATGIVSATQVAVTSLIALTDLGAEPTGAVGNLCSVNGDLKYHDGTSWKTVTVS